MSRILCATLSAALYAMSCSATPEPVQTPTALAQEDTVTEAAELRVEAKQMLAKMAALKTRQVADWDAESTDMMVSFAPHAASFMGLTRQEVVELLGPPDPIELPAESDQVEVFMWTIGRLPEGTRSSAPMLTLTFDKAAGVVKAGVQLAR